MEIIVATCIPANCLHLWGRQVATSQIPRNSRRFPEIPVTYQTDCLYSRVGCTSTFVSINWLLNSDMISYISHHVTYLE